MPIPSIGLSQHHQHQQKQQQQQHPRLWGISPGLQGDTYPDAGRPQAAGALADASHSDVADSAVQQSTCKCCSHTCDDTIGAWFYLLRAVWLWVLVIVLATAECTLPALVLGLGLLCMSILRVIMLLVWQVDLLGDAGSSQSSVRPNAWCCDPQVDLGLRSGTSAGNSLVAPSMGKEILASAVVAPPQAQQFEGRTGKPSRLRGVLRNVYAMN